MILCTLFCQDSELLTTVPCGSHRKLTWNPRKKLSSQLSPYVVPLYELAFSEDSLSGWPHAEGPLCLVCLMGRLVHCGYSTSANDKSPPARGGWPGREHFAPTRRTIMPHGTTPF